MEFYTYKIQSGGDPILSRKWGQWTKSFHRSCDVECSRALDRMWKAITSPWTVADIARRSKVKESSIEIKIDISFPLNSPNHRYLPNKGGNKGEKSIEIKIEIVSIFLNYCQWHHLFYSWDSLLILPPQ